MTTVCKHENNTKCIYCEIQKYDPSVKTEKELLFVSNSLWNASPSSYGRRNCDCCNGIDQPYMIKNNLWNKVSQGDRFLCLECVESRLGRDLKLEDFTPALINYGVFRFDVRNYIKGEKV